jgi:hypothetical protein
MEEARTMKRSIPSRALAILEGTAAAVIASFLMGNAAHALSDAPTQTSADRAGRFTLLPQYVASGGPPPEIAAATESAAFDQADADADGELTLDEFRSFHEAMQKEIEAAHFARIDADRDGGLTLQELQSRPSPQSSGFGGQPPKLSR